MAVLTRPEVVWFKRDLRVHDHRPLAAAAARGPVLPLYIAEPALWRQPDAAGRHWAFIAESLRELRADLARLGQPLVVRVGEAVDVLEAIRAAHGIAGLWSHEETGNGFTYERDVVVADWARRHGIPWTEIRQDGVVRRLRSRDGWASRWDRFMAEPQTPAPALAPLAGVDPAAIPSAEDLSIAADPCPERQRGGRAEGLALLGSFLDHRAQDYRRGMSSPVSGASACSRLSPHLAFGTVSLREVTQATWARRRALRSLGGDAPKGFAASLHSFVGRLHWHCHFMQKLEDEPRIELENVHRGCDGLRDPVPDPERLGAWARGETGYPFVDACMRALQRSGWINFRMRAMLISFASYHLWMHWREPGLVLARLFTDYEPGIHWSQAQMQSGTTGINTIRIYSPIKQSLDQDPDGTFIRAHLPELAALPTALLHTPWAMTREDESRFGIRLGRDYPRPIVEHAAAVKAAKDRIFAARRLESFSAEADRIQAKHGSRRSGLPQVTRRLRRRNSDRQLALALGEDGR